MSGTALTMAPAAPAAGNTNPAVRVPISEAIKTTATKIPPNWKMLTAREDRFGGLLVIPIA